MSARNLSKRQKRVIDMFGREVPYATSLRARSKDPSVFTWACGFKRPEVTIKSLVRRGILQELKYDQLSIDGVADEVGSGLFVLTSYGESIASRRSVWHMKRSNSLTFDGMWE